MPSFNSISLDNLSRLIDRPDSPVLRADPRLIPSAVCRRWNRVSGWASEFEWRSAVAICQKELKPNEGVAAWLRHAGVRAHSLEREAPTEAPRNLASAVARLLSGRLLTVSPFG
jgi:hypothetical protein